MIEHTEWRYKIYHGGGSKHTVFGKPHKDGGDYAPLFTCSEPDVAQLAAAAPELRVVCMRLLRLHYDQGKPSAEALEIVNQAEAIITKSKYKP